MKKQDDIHVIDDAPYNEPAADELVIRTMAVAINPADVMLQRLGIIIDTYPAILGCDAAGIVEEVGSDIKDFKKGDRVLGTTKPLQGGIYKYSGFQQYVLLQMPLIAKVPDNVSFTDATVLPLGIQTAASCLFHDSTLALEMPPSQSGVGKTLIVWGASSSVGSGGVQLAAAAGYEVFGVASQRNHALVKSLGAKQTFDYNSPKFVDDIVAALKGKPSVGAFDAISKETTITTICEILHQSGGKKLIAGVAPGIENFTKHDVTIVNNFKYMASRATVDQHIWRVFLEPALATGAIKYAPPADVVGHGLEDIQKACDLHAAGISGKKIVISL